jgi:hypothetical protein
MKHPEPNVPPSFEMFKGEKAKDYEVTGVDSYNPYRSERNDDDEEDRDFALVQAPHPDSPNSFPLVFGPNVGKGPLDPNQWPWRKAIPNDENVEEDEDDEDGDDEGWQPRQ